MKRFSFLLAMIGTIVLASVTFAGVGPTVIINEVDADTSGTDILEFVELYDGGAGNTSLDGLVVVFFNGSDDASYVAYDLDGFSTDGNGYFLLGNSGVVPTPSIIFASNGLQNGADAVALYTGDDTDFPNDTPVTTTNLIDAIVYDTNDGDDAGLLPLLNASEPQVNEDGQGDKDFHSNQRCANGAGGARNTSSYVQATPTPGAANGSPTIDSDPGDQQPCDGGQAVFAVSANGVTYQWRKDLVNLVDGGNIAGATTDILTVDPVSAADVGSYDCVVSNDCGSVTSAAASLTLGGSTTITTQPNGTTTFVGATAAFKCEGEGAPPVTYQWRKNSVNLTDGGNISGSTTSTLMISPVALADADDYDCVVTSGCGSTTSDTATLTVIETVPTAVINEIRIDQGGTDFDEYFELAGAPGTSLDGLTYIVIGDDTPEQGIIEAVIPLDGLSIPADGVFLATEDTFGLGCADDADLILLGDPDNEINFENSDNVTHMLVAGFSGFVGDDLDIEDDCVLDVTPWFSILDDVSLKESDPPDCFYSTNVVGPDGSFVPAHVFRCPTGTGSFQIGAFGTCVDTESPGRDNPPCVLVQPVDVLNACEGDPVSFSVTAAGTGTLSYQWQLDAINLTDDGRISGATTDTLTIDPVFVSDAGEYTCQVTDDNATSTSDGADLTVDPLYAVRAGNVNAAVTPVTDVLTINGSAGSSPQREILVSAANDALVLNIASPPSLVRAKYCIYLWNGEPTKDTLEVLPQSVGDIAMPTPLTGDSPQPIKIANNLKAALGTDNWFGPWSPIAKSPYDLVDLPIGGVPASKVGARVYFQGIIQDTGSLHGGVAVTNGIVLEIVP